MIRLEELREEVAQLLSVEVSIVVLVVRRKVLGEHLLEVVSVAGVVPKLVEDVSNLPFFKLLANLDSLSSRGKLFSAKLSTWYSRSLELKKLTIA